MGLSLHEHVELRETSLLIPLLSIDAQKAIMHCLFVGIFCFFPPPKDKKGSIGMDPE
jgi:hypothetical protein